MVLSATTSQSMAEVHPRLETSLSGQLLDSKRPESFFYSFWYELKYVSAGYQKYRRKEFSLAAFVLLQVLTSLYFIYNDFVIYYDFPETMWGYVNIWFNTFSMAIGWFLAMYYIVRKCRIDSPLWKVPTWFQRMEHVWVFTVSFAIMIHIGFLAYFATEVEQNHYTPKRGTMPEASMVASMILPTLLYMVVKGSTLRVICVVWVLLFMINFLLMIYFNLMYSMKTIIILMPFSTFLLVEFHRQNWASFVLTEKLQRLIMENRRMSEEINANELRHMIGNVAHDLKTPLTSFVAGIDMIASITTELRNLMTSNHHEHVDYIVSKLKTIGQVTKDVTHTNTFMMMTINRCLEYNKSLHGLKLVPKIEKVNIKEAIWFPISCMKNWDNKVPLVLNPIAYDIFPFVFTDKQWLQENLLCLLANAIKYSTKGAIHIRVSLDKMMVPVDQVLEVEEFESDEVGMHGSLKLSSVVPFNGYDTTLDQYVTATCEKEISFVKFEVIDTGPGMTAKDMQIFDDPKHAARLTGGTGLGLYSLARRMEALNGAYGVDPRTDGEQGSIFWFSIPYKPFARNVRKCSTVAEESMNISVASMNSRSLSKSIPSIIAPSITTIDTIQWTTPLRILVVDDSIVIVKMASTLLQRQGHQVITASNGLEGVGIVKQSLEGELPPMDVILMDFQMPIMAGDAVREIRMLEKSIPVSESRLKEDALERSHRSANSDVSGRPILKSPKYRNRGFSKDQTNKEELQVISLEDETSKSISFSKDKYIDKSKAMKGALDQSNHSTHSNASAYSSTNKRHVKHYIIGFSAKTDTDLISDGYAAGIDAFMSKPFTIQSFNETMMKLITTTSPGGNRNPKLKSSAQQEVNQVKS